MAVKAANTNELTLLHVITYLLSKVDKLVIISSLLEPERKLECK